MIKALALANVAGFFASVFAQGSVSDTPGTTTTTTTTTTSAAPAGQALYGQCGGIYWTGWTVCQPPATCVYNNPYHSQCLIVSSTSTTSTTTTVPPPTQTHWGQCGGQGYTGLTLCASPYTCVYSSPYFSQCL